MSIQKYLETKKLNLSKDMINGYAIPYSYLETLLEEYASIEVNSLIDNHPTPVEILLESSDKNRYKTDERRIGFQQGAKWIVELLKEQKK